MKRHHASTWMLVGLWTTAAVWFAASMWLIQNQTVQAERLADGLEQVADAVLAERWPEADERLIEVRNRWERIRRNWALHVEHSELDDIADALAEAKASIQTADRQALVPLRRAVDRIRILPERERLMMQNVW